MKNYYKFQHFIADLDFILKKYVFQLFAKSILFLLAVQILFFPQEFSVMMQINTLCFASIFLLLHIIENH